jgi:hypothetical protein
VRSAGSVVLKWLLLLWSLTSLSPLQVVHRYLWSTGATPSRRVLQSDVAPSVRSWGPEVCPCCRMACFHRTIHGPGVGNRYRTCCAATSQAYSTTSRPVAFDPRCPRSPWACHVFAGRTRGIASVMACYSAWMEASLSYSRVGQHGHGRVGRFTKTSGSACFPG